MSYVCRGGVVVAIGLAVSSFGPVRANAGPIYRPDRDQIGVNLAPLNALSTQWDFNDLMKNAARWYVPDSPQSDQVTFDKHNWPTFIPDEVRFVGTNVRLDVGRRKPDYPAGDYKVTWQGKGQFRLSVDADSPKINADGAGSRLVPIHPGDQPDGVYMKIYKTDPSDPLRNIAIHMPGYGPGQPNAGVTFHKKLQKRFQSVGAVRFMDWMNGNASPIKTWSDRPRPSDRRYTTGKGVPVEKMVDLANQLDKDAWFNMPYQADADYVRHFANYVKNNLDPSHKAYVEYGNEMWAVGKSKNDYLKNLAKKDFGERYLWYKEWAKRTKKDFSIWRDVFGDQADSRVVRVAAAQAHNRYHSPRFFEALDGHFDALSIAAYAGFDTSKYDGDTTPADIIRDFKKDIAHESNTDTAHYPDSLADLIGNTQPKGDWAYFKELADYYTSKLGRDIPLVAYEGGEGLAPHNTTKPWFDAYLKVQSDPKMAEVYRLLLQTWFGKLGAAGFMHYNSVDQTTRYGAWGLLERQDQPTAEAPKYRGLTQFATGATPVPEPTSLALLGLGGLALLHRPRRRGAAHLSDRT